MARVSDRIPVTFEAAEKDPIRNGRLSVSFERGLEPGQVDPPVAILADRDHVGDRLAPRQLVAVVLVRPDEHDRPLALRDSCLEPIPLVERRRNPQLQDADEEVDRAGHPRARKDHRVIVGVAAHRVTDDRPRVLAKSAGLEARSGRLGVRVGVQGQDGFAQIVLDERQGSTGGRVVRVDDPTDPERSRNGLVVADDRGADQLDHGFGIRPASMLGVRHGSMVERRVLESSRNPTRVAPRNAVVGAGGSSLPWCATTPRAGRRLSLRFDGCTRTLTIGFPS